MEQFDYLLLSEREIEAAAFRAIALFVEKTFLGYSNIQDRITGAEGIIIGIVDATERLLALKRSEEPSE